MNTSNYRFTLDIQSTMSQASLPVRLGDTNRSLYITITEGGKPYVLNDGFTAAFAGKKSDGHTLINYCIIENKSVVRYDFTKQTANVAGLVDCEIRIYDPEGKVVTSPKFVMVVDERVVYSEDLDLSEDESDILDNIIATEQKRAAAETARAEAETARVEAETERAEAETERAEAEEARDTAEAARAEAEEARATAEEGRVKTLNAIMEAIESGEFDPKYTSVTLLASAWKGEEDPYSQVVTIPGVTEYSKVDLLPSVEQLAIFHDKDIAFVTENDNGVVTVYAIGDKPTQDYTIEVCITEVKV